MAEVEKPQMFGFLAKRVANPSDKLRDQLFLLVEKDLLVEFEELCRQNSREIAQEFDQWQQVPSKLRTQPKKLQAYANGLMAVARKMADLGDDRPMDLLSESHGPGGPSNWRSALRQALQHIEKLSYGDAVRLLEPFVQVRHDIPESDLKAYQAVTLARLGECEFQLAHFDKAEAWWKKALNCYLQKQDWDGIQSCYCSLYELERYRGELEAAKAHAVKLGLAMRERQMPDGLARRLARAVDKPPVRAVALLEGQIVEPDDLPPNLGAVEFTLERNRVTLSPAQALILQGRTLMAEGQHQAALESYSKAAQLDAYDPECRASAGLALLHLKRYSEALATYKQLERLAPGWATARHDLWLAHELTHSKVSHEQWLMEIALNQRPLEPGEQLARVEQALVKFPQHAPFHLAQGLAFLELQQGDRASQSFQRALELAGNEDLKSRILLAASRVISNPEVRQQLLQQITALRFPNLIAAATARSLLRS